MWPVTCLWLVPNNIKQKSYYRKVRSLTSFVSNVADFHPFLDGFALIDAMVLPWGKLAKFFDRSLSSLRSNAVIEFDTPRVAAPAPLVYDLLLTDSKTSHSGRLSIFSAARVRTLEWLLCLVLDDLDLFKARVSLYGRLPVVRADTFSSVTLCRKEGTLLLGRLRRSLVFCRSIVFCLIIFSLDCRTNFPLSMLDWRIIFVSSSGSSTASTKILELLEWDLRVELAVPLVRDFIMTSWREICVSTT
jgi:hypothetical protein